MKHLRILVYKDGEYLLAQCLEHDICIQDKKLEDLYLKMELTLLLELESSSDKSLNHIPPAPTHFEEKWNSKYRTDLYRSFHYIQNYDLHYCYMNLSECEET